MILWLHVPQRDTKKTFRREQMKNVKEYLKGKSELKAAKKRLQALENEIKAFESKHKLELKDHFDISLSSAKSKVMLNKEELLKLIKTDKSELIIHFKKPISLSWKEITTLRELFAKEVSSIPAFWNDLRDNKNCQYFLLETSKFDGCK